MSGSEAVLVVVVVCDGPTNIYIIVRAGELTSLYTYAMYVIE